MKQMNKEVFIRKNGLHYLSELLRLLHSRDWDVNTYNMKLLEVVILEALHPLAARFIFRRYLLFQINKCTLHSDDLPDCWLRKDW